jgi:hypothetical protein
MPIAQMAAAMTTARPWRVILPVQPLNTPMISAPTDIAESSQPTDSVRRLMKAKKL